MEPTGVSDNRAKRIKQWRNISISAVAALLLFTLVLAIPYYRLARRVDQRLAGPLQNTVDYYAASEIVSPGDPMSTSELAAALKRAGYSFTTNNDPVTVSAEPAVKIGLSNGKVASIVETTSGRSLPNFQLQPQVMTDVSEGGRVKRMPVRFFEIPPVMVQAVLSAEDKRFFKHSGLDTLRIAKAIYVDLRERRKRQGASTISMQLARNLWLRHDKSWKRKVEEAFITVHLEHKLSKNQIFEEYCNLVYLGGQGPFCINGIGEAAQAYFNKDIRNLNLTEAATLAGLIQRPVYFNPFRYPNRALDRRNVVLRRMRENKYISDQQYQEAIAAPLGLRPSAGELSESQYLI